MQRYGLRDDQWERIRELLPRREGTVGVTTIPWRDLPERFRDGVQVQRRFSR
jgi:hypothetical protein